MDRRNQRQRLFPRALAFFLLALFFAVSPAPAQVSNLPHPEPNRGTDPPSAANRAVQNQGAQYRSETALPGTAQAPAGRTAPAHTDAGPSLTLSFEPLAEEPVIEEAAETGEMVTESNTIPDEMKSKEGFIPAPVHPLKIAQNAGGEKSPSQDEEQTPPPSEKTEEVDAHEIVVKKQLSGPKQTVSFFMHACGKSNYFDAIRSMDFSRMPELNKADRQSYAHQLAAILVRLDNFDIEKIPEHYDQDECYLWPDHNYKALSLTRAEDGTWQFSASTVSDIPAIYEQIKNKKPVFFNDTILGKLPDIFFTRFAGILVLQWCILGVFFLAGLLALKIIPVVISWLILLFTKFGRSKHEYSKKFQWALRPLAYIGMAWIWFAGLIFTSTYPALIHIAFIILHPLCVIMLMLMLLRVVDIFKYWLQVHLNTSVNKVKSVLVDLSSGVLKFLVICTAVVAIVQIFGISALGILSGMGIGGVAVALAAQQTISNFFGSMTILLDHPFTVGDYIIVGSIEGVVERIGLRSTSIKTFYDSRVVIPNGQLATDVVDNMGRRQSRRFKTTLGLQYDTPVPLFEAFVAGVRRLIEDRTDTRKDDIRVSVNDFGPSSIDIQMICFFVVANVHEELRSRQELILDIMNLASRLGVSFAFPSQTTYMVPSENLTYPIASQISGRPAALSLGKDFAAQIFAEKNQEQK
ncbi:MAG: mechanosensitive ion channel [Thermoguttaceae bacterium]|nr:mechanosensitive ion channel [Thermoguttaceae bacterium]